MPDSAENVRATTDSAKKPRGRRRGKHQIRRNKRLGARYATQLEKKLVEKYKYVFKEVQVKGNAKLSGFPDKHGRTSEIGLGGGSPAKGDYLAGNSLDDLIVIEAKANPESPYTKNQKREYPRINEYGGEIVHKKSLENIADKSRKKYKLTGRSLKPKSTMTLYQIDVVSIDQGITNWDELISKRKGVFRPKPTPTPMSPALDGSGLGLRGTSERAIGNSSVPNEHHEKLSGSRKSNKLSDQIIGGTKLRGGPGGKRLPSTTPKPTGLSDDINLRIKPGRFAFSLVKGLVIGILQDLILGWLVGYFEGRIAKETQRSIINAWPRVVYPFIEYQFEKQVSNSVKGKQPDDYKVYLGVKWALVTQEMDDEAADVVVFFIKFATGNPGFVEIYHSLEVQKDDTLLKLETKRKPPMVNYKRKRDSNHNDLIRYPQLQWILVHDPEVLKISKDLKDNIYRKQIILQKIANLYEKVDPNVPYIKYLLNANSALQKYQLFLAGTNISKFKKAVDQIYSFNAKMLSNMVVKLNEEIAKIRSGLMLEYIYLNREQHGLLNIYLGVNLEIYK